MDADGMLTERRFAAYLLILCFLVFIVVGLLFTGRTVWHWPGSNTSLYLRWERGLVIASFLINLLGFALLENLLREAGDTIIARLALTVYLVSAAVIVNAEMSLLGSGAWAYPQIVAHVVLAFLAQAAFGAALLRTGLTPGWVGWATILWNLGWLVILPIVNPRDIYFPVLHHVGPLIVGIVLLVR